jgi:acetyltransferase
MGALLDGVRGEPPVERSRLAAAICRFAMLAVQCPELVEMEVNPLVAGPTDLVAVDARATLTPPVAAEASPPRARGVA